MKFILYAFLLMIVFSVLAFVVSEMRAYKGNAEGEKDFLLILGCRVRGNEAEETLRMRCEKAAEYLREHKSTVAIASGGIVHKDQYISEAQAIADLLVSKGIEKERIILEDKSATTVENFRNTKRIIDDMSGCDFDKIAFLSSDFHLLRAHLIGKKQGLSCQTVSASSPKKELVKNYIREFFALIIFFTGGK